MSCTPKSPRRSTRAVAGVLLALGPWWIAACEGDTGDTGPAGPPGDPGSDPTPTDLALDEDAPGIQVDIIAVDGASGADGTFQVGDTVRVTFTVHKDDGSDWEDLAEFSSGRALLSGPTFNYQRVLPEKTDVRAAAVDNGDGTWTYTFADPIPAVYEPPLNDTPSFGPDDGELSGMPLVAGTYTVAVYFRWDYSAGGDNFRDLGEALEDVLFLGSASLLPREVVRPENCNQCHSDLRAHGTNRKSVGLCLLCHTAGAEDRNNPMAAGGTPGASIEFKVMIHRIHNGAHLPSTLGVATNPDGSRDYAATPVPYELVGFMDSVHDYSHIEFPAWPNLDFEMPVDAGYSGLTSDQQDLEDTILRGVTECAICHGDPDGAGPLVEPAQGDLALIQPTRRACGSCHDDIDWDLPYTANFLTMPPQADDATCAGCHPAAGTGLSVEDAHRHPLLDPAIDAGLRFELLSADEAGANDGDGTFDPGEKISVTFNVLDDAGLEVDGSTLDSFNVGLSGPNENRNLVLLSAFPPAALGGAQPYTSNLPELLQLEFVGDATGGADVFGTAATPHWNVAGAETEVWVRTATGGGSSSLAEGAEARQNFLDLADATGFDRDDTVVIDDGVGGFEEYLTIQFVEGNRIWFSSPATTSYAPGTRVAHPLGASVDEVTLTQVDEGVDWSLDPLTGAVTELTEFGAGNAVLVSYTTDFVLPDAYPMPLNESPDVGEAQGEWRGKSLVSGTYALGLWGYLSLPYSEFGEDQTYRSASRLGELEVLVGDAMTLEPYDLISAADNCYDCHRDVYFHGGTRRGVHTCLMCHGTAGAEDRPPYVAGAAPATTGVGIGFREMLHKIHHGQDLAEADSYTLVGFGIPSAYPFNFSEHTYGEVVFPALNGGTANCAMCHGDSNEAWTVPADRDHPSEQLQPVQEWRMVCGSCHDDEAAQAHIGTMTDPFTGLESCNVCHGPGEDLAVESVHQVR